MSENGSTGIEIRIHLDDSEDPPHLSSIHRDVVTDLALHVLVGENCNGGELDIVICGDGRMAELNAEWFGREGPTDVMAFDLSDDPAGDWLEGEIYVDLVQAERQAPTFDSSLDEEIRRLVIHGVLHLMGYSDTDTPEEAERMNERQERYVAEWSISVLEEAV